MNKKKFNSPITNPVVVAALEDMNKEIIFVHHTKEVVRLNPKEGETKLSYTSVYNFKQADFSNRSVMVDGNPVYLAEQWMKYPKRNEAWKTVYEPAQPRITEDGNLNVWFPSKCIPKKGDLTLFFQYMDYLFKSDPTYRKWFLIWLAYPLQKPGTKLLTGCFFWSNQQGNGKSTLGNFMRRIYGEHNSSLIKENEMFARFNDHLQNKLFIFVDELQRDGSGKKADVIKPLITQPTVQIETKYQRPYELVDRMNYYITSNHIESLHLDPEDRRFFVHNLGSTKAPKTFFGDFYNWLDNEGGCEAIYYHLLNEVDINEPIVGGDPYSQTPAKFNPEGEAPHSKAREALINASLDDADTWIQEIIESPQNILGDLKNCTIFRSRELFDRFKLQNPHHKISAVGFGRKLSKILFKLNNDNPLVLFDGTRDRMLTSVLGRENLCAEQVRAIHSTERSVQ